MGTRYFMENVDSDLTVPGDNFDKFLNLTRPSTTLFDVGIAGSSTETDYGFTRSTQPLTGARTPLVGTWRVRVQVNDESFGDVDLKVQLHRVNSSGVIQASSPQSASQDVLNGALFFDFPALDLGTFSSTDRLRVDFEWFNQNLLADTITITFGGFTEDANVHVEIPDKIDVDDDPIAVTDTVGLEFERSASDSESTADQAGLTHEPTPSDAVAAADQTSIQVDKQVSDSADTADQAGVTHFAEPADAEGAADAAAREAQFEREPADSETAEDALAIEFTGVFLIATCDLLESADAVAREHDAERAPQDSEATADQAGVTHLIELADAGAAADAAAREAVFPRSAADTAAAADAAAREAVFGRSASDAEGVTDALLEEDIYCRPETDTPSATDAVAREAEFGRSAADAEAAADAADRFAEFFRSAMDAAIASDAVLAEMFFERALADAEAAADAVDRVHDAVRIPQDAVAAADAAAREAEFERELVDAGLTLDALLEEDIYCRPETDTAAVADAVTAIADTFVVDLADAISASDRAGPRIPHPAPTRAIFSRGAPLDAFRRGDTSPEIDVRLLGADGLPVNLTGATARVRARFARDKAIKVDRAATIVDAAGGRVRIDLEPPDTDRSGVLELELRVTYGDFRRETFPDRDSRPLLLTRLA